jgi:hypothetical protein
VSGKYWRVTAEIEGLEVVGLDAVVRSRLVFDLNPGVSADEACAQIRQRGKQIGALIKAEQRIDNLRSWNGSAWLTYTLNDQPARDCALAFGERPGDAWVGFLLPAGEPMAPEFTEPGRMGYRMEFTLRTFRSRLQAIPFVHACADEDIGEFHTLSVFVLRERRPRLESSVGRWQPHPPP